MMSSKENLLLLLNHNYFPKSTTWKNKECFLIMTSSYLELLLIITTYLSYKLILRNILWFGLNLFFYTGEKLPLQFVWSASKDTKVPSMVAPGECYEPENKQKCTEPERERMSGDLMELNDTELNYINFGDETDSDNTIRIYFKQFSIVRTSEGFSIRDILHWKTNFVFLDVKFLWIFWLKRFFYICVILILLKMSIKIPFLKNFQTCHSALFKIISTHKEQPNYL